ncbi:MAG: cyclomaltodextrinase N-terminal domain-containing protein [Chitinophagaceae bacterium]|nr:cyclomaltodextrinase N-terminal domain-containing protein [Chitinophagaceae bacterium]
MKKYFIFLVAAWCFSFVANAQNIYPTHWWTDMKNPNLQLLLYEKDIANNYDHASTSYPGVDIISTEKLANKNYLVINLVINSGTKPGDISIQVRDKKNKLRNIFYSLKKRSEENAKTRITGVSSEDLIYLIMPDRFSNGDPSNDKIPGLRDQSLNRDSIYDRHGGDLKGIQNHLDYLQDLGVTALWLNPVILNDMRNRTEHGYAFTDHYKIDPRIGGEKAYHDLSNALHQRGMKLIQDAVYNHTGLEHFLYRDMPDSTWFHKWPVYTQTTYKDQVLFDPYASQKDFLLMSDGWFVRQMPDVNQKNPYFANYLIQHAIWSTEEFGLDGWRIDTYAYNDLEFMNRCNQALLDEFPNIHLFGETWVHGMVNQAYFTENKLDVPFKSNLPGVTDFQTHLYGILPALKESFGWSDGVNKLYTTLASDIIYEDPMKHVIFLDNHDKTRFFTEINEDFEKYKIGIGWLLTSRGIPQLYYGNEILMKGASNPDGWVRLDFPGGWEGDKQNKFLESGRTEQENEAFNYVKTFANFRKNSSAIKTGKLMQYVPVDGVYVYFRYDEDQTIMCIMNTADVEKEIDMDRFTERIKDFSQGKNIVSGQINSLTGKLKCLPKSFQAIELVR